MKKEIGQIVIKIIILLGIIGTIGKSVEYGININRKTEYCGIITKKFKSSAGYKVREKSYIIFYNDSLKRNIVVNVNYTTYYNSKISDNICFNLRKIDLEK